MVRAGSSSGEELGGRREVLDQPGQVLVPVARAQHGRGMDGGQGPVGALLGLGRLGPVEASASRGTDPERRAVHGGARGGTEQYDAAWRDEVQLGEQPRLAGSDVHARGSLVDALAGGSRV